MKKITKIEALKLAIELASAYDQVGEVSNEDDTRLELLTDIFEWETKQDVKAWFEENYCTIPELKELLDDGGFSRLNNFMGK